MFIFNSFNCLIVQNYNSIGFFLLWVSFWKVVSFRKPNTLFLYLCKGETKTFKDEKTTHNQQQPSLSNKDFRHKGYDGFAFGQMEISYFGNLDARRQTSLYGFNEGSGRNWHKNAVERITRFGDESFDQSEGFGHQTRYGRISDYGFRKNPQTYY